jgi:hypothetical protein
MRKQGRAQAVLESIASFAIKKGSSAMRDAMSCLDVLVG